MKRTKTTGQPVAPCVLTLAFLTLVFAGTTGAFEDPGSQRTEIVRTEEGPLSGLETNRMREFLGIPYATPPVGNLRWRPPQPHAPWDEPLDAVRFGNTCPQNQDINGFATPSDHEDCLFLNVFTPVLGDGGDDDAGRPVMVWIYGGGLNEGESNDYDPSDLVKRGGVVFVSMNYRVNVFGFFAHPALDNEGHRAGNYGLMDQQLALKWVKDNIRSFGGDPNNVTIFGESAGANSSWAHVGSPASAGLFQKAIIESSSGTLKFLSATLQSKEPLGEQLAVNTGCSDQTAACLRSLSVEALLAANNAAPSASGLTVDGTIIPKPLLELVQTDQFNHVPLIAGTNRDENTWFQGNTELRTGHVQTSADYVNSVMSTFGANGSAVLALYPVGNYPTPTNALAAVTGDRGFICGTRRTHRLLRRMSITTFGYEFNDRTAHVILDKPVSFPTLAGHTSELPYIFPLFHGGAAPIHPLDAKQERLADRMVDYWTTFARTGAQLASDALLAALRDSYRSL